MTCLVRYMLVCCLVVAEVEKGSTFVLTPRRFKSTAFEAQRRRTHQAATVDDNTILESSVLGALRRIRIPGEDEDVSFLGANSVPTFSSTFDSQRSITPATITASAQQRRARGLEGVLGQGPAFVVDNIFSKKTCDELIQTCETLGFGSYRAGKNHHGALQILVSQKTSDAVGQALAPLVDIDDVLSNMMTTEENNRTLFEDIRLTYRGLNRRWRVYRYEPGGAETFAPHIDAGFPPSSVSDDGETLLWDAATDSEEQIVSRLTVLMYLNDDFVAGETNFYRPLADLPDEYKDATPIIASVRPRMGSVLVFPQAVGEDAVDYARRNWPVHEGAPVTDGSPKYVIRSDILFATERKPLQLDDKLFRFDHLVRDTFMPHSEVYSRAFLHHVSSLYNPHMGVENLAPFLYSFVRFTKQRQILEIGAGYTTLWILQALKDNDQEMERIHQLEQKDECRLLDCQWSIPDVVNDSSKVSSSLLCVDNCVHQKETATGAAAIAEELGLGHYLEFLKQDAFELDLEPESIDMLWCDFGVGARMREFVSRAWSAIRPGGFLLCHSTLTNQRTRQWLEAARLRKGQDLTGIPPDEYVEISLLEPHKRYQNSVSVFQKRKGNDGKQVEEPIYSEYA